MRYFTRISESDLRIKIEAALEKHDDSIVEVVSKDLKVSFDCENVTDERYHFGPAPDLIGYHTLDNGLTFYGVAAGGDWQIPLFFLIYWSGKELRGYIPTDGNPWNTDTKTAYGDDPEDDLKNARKRFGKHISETDMEDLDIPNAKELIIGDIQERIKCKT